MFEIREIGPTFFYWDLKPAKAADIRSKVMIHIY